MKKILMAIIAAMAIGAFASTASADHPHYGGRPSCGGGYYAGHNAYYRPTTNIRISYGTPGYMYGYAPYYRSSYYRSVPSYYGWYGYSPYQAGYSPYYGGRGGVSFFLGF